MRNKRATCVAFQSVTFFQGISEKQSGERFAFWFRHEYDGGWSVLDMVDSGIEMQTANTGKLSASFI